MEQFHNTRTDGELSDPLILQHIKSGTPSPETNLLKINFTPAQLAKALDVCRMGEKLEPQNAYLMRAYFLLIDWQDAKAWQVLHEAATKTYWNDHFIDYRNLFAQSSSKILKRPLSSFEAFIIASEISEFNYSKTREMAKDITWQGVKQNRAGHPEKALQIWSDGYRTFTLAAQGEDDEIIWAVDGAVLEIFGDGVRYSNRTAYEKHPDTYGADRKITDLIALAEKLHRPDLANELRNDWRKNDFIRQKMFPYKDYMKAMDVILYRSFHGMALAELVSALIVSGVVLILLLLGSLFLWIITTCLQFFGSGNCEISPLTLREKISGLTICSGIISFFGGLLFIYLLKFLPNADLSDGWAISGLFSSPYNSDLKGRIMDSAFSLFAGIDTPWRFLILLTPLVCAIFYSLYKMKKEENKNYKHLALTQTLKIVHLFLLFSAWGIAVMMSNYEFVEIVILAIIASFMLISFGWMFVTTQKTNAAKTLRLLQTAAIGVMCLSSILIVPVLIKQAAVDRQLKPWADNSLHGEMHQYHHVVDAPP